MTHQPGARRTPSAAPPTGGPVDERRPREARRGSGQPARRRRGPALPARPVHRERAARVRRALGGGAPPRRGHEEHHGIGERTGTSSATISHVTSGCATARTAIGRVGSPGPRRAPTMTTASAPLRVAVPNRVAWKRRRSTCSTAQGSSSSYRSDGSPQVPGADVELLFVRTEDVAEYVADSLVDLGLTGADLVAEHGGECAPSSRSASEPCSLVLAVPRDVPAGSSPTSPAAAWRPRSRVRPRSSPHRASGAGRRGARRSRGYAAARGHDAVVDLVASGSAT